MYDPSTNIYAVLDLGFEDFLMPSFGTVNSRGTVYYQNCIYVQREEQLATGPDGYCPSMGKTELARERMRVVEEIQEEEKAKEIFLHHEHVSSPEITSPNESLFKFLFSEGGVATKQQHRCSNQYCNFQINMNKH